jgi:methylation protein EvaC
MTAHFKDFAKSVLESDFISGNNPFIVELGCNDGILLKNFAELKVRHLGIEPSLNVAKVANEEGVQTISEFFTEKLAESIVKKHGQADVFLAANVMCHIPDIIDVVKGIKKLLKPTGVVMFEDPYLGDIISKVSYDQIYDEHVFLFSALSVKYLFSLHGMALIDVIPQQTHGGSMRYVLANEGVYSASDSVNQLLLKEKSQGLDKTTTFEKFSRDVAQSKIELKQLLEDLKKQGKRVVGYAATSKSTTILNYCGVGPELIEYICDTTPIKQGKYSPGMHIPIVPYEVFKMNPPDYAFLFAWNHLDEVMEKEKQFASSGGKWLTHVPRVKIL